MAKRSRLEEACIFVLHLGIFGTNFYALVYDILYISINGSNTFNYKGYGGKFKHLTFWDQILQTVYFGICVWNDIFGTNTKPGEDPSNRSALEKLRDTCFVSLAFPVGSFVVVTFWGIYSVDRELVYPRSLDKIIPSWLNHVMHSTVILFLLLDMFATYHPYPSRKKGFKITLVFAAIYQVWLLWIAYYANYWVYTVLKVLSWPQRIAFFAVLWIFFGILYILGEKLMDVFWKTSATERVREDNESTSIEKKMD